MKYDKYTAISTYYMSNDRKHLFEQYDSEERCWKMIDKEGNEYTRPYNTPWYGYERVNKTEPENKETKTETSTDWSGFMIAMFALFCVAALALIICAACCA